LDVLLIWKLSLLLIPLGVFELYLASKLKYDLHMLQQNSYRNDRYYRWYIQRQSIRRNWSAWLPSLFFIIGSLLELWLVKVDFLITPVVLIPICLILLLLKRRPVVKKPLVMTARAKRLLLIAITVSIFLSIALMISFNILAIKRRLLPFIVLYTILPAFSAYYLMLINWLLQPLEKHINANYLSEAKRIFAGKPELKRVAITGSYGKTSCKMILAAILEEKYITLVTPESVNTPMGITRVIREQLKPIHEVFICEMGAKQGGDIAELCDLVQPHIGILTAIGPQHLETFGSLEAIANTKFELIHALPADGLAVLNLNNEEIIARYKQAPCQVVGYGLDDICSYHAENVHYNSQGVSFTLVDPHGEKQPIRSRLLGRHNIENLIGASAVAAEMGITLSQIARAIRTIDPIPHRMQLISSSGYTIIDDAFNSNPLGAAAALDVLNQMGEKQKILITPGMVELGEKQDELNLEFAVSAAKVCDYIILVGKKHSLPLQIGLQKEHFPLDRYSVVADLIEAKEILANIVRPGAVVMFENDLPDTYSE